MEACAEHAEQFAMPVGFIGRDRELAELLAGLASAFRGEGSVILLAGEPGIGKTTLAERVAEHATAEGARVVWSRSWDGGATAPYWTWAQVVRTLTEDLGDDALRSFISPETAHVTLLAPALAERFGDVAKSMLELDSDAGRFYLFEATARFLKHASCDVPLVLVLDDVLAGDRPSLQLLRFLARDVRTARILVLATYRDTEAVQAPDTVEVLSDLVRDGQVLDLNPLNREEVSQLIVEVAGTRPQTGTVAAIHEATGGNPLFVREVTRLLATGGGFDLPHGRTVPVPDTVRAVIRRRMAPLSAEAIQVLSAAAVVGRDFDITLVAAACDFPTDRALAALAAAVALGFVAEVPETVGTYRFCHPLMREAIYEGLPIAVRVQMHQRVGGAIERLHGPDSTSHIGELAHHFTRAIPLGESVRAGEYARRAGDRAMSAFAYEEAVTQYRRALDALAVRGEPDAALRCDLLLRLGRAQARAGDYQESKKTFLLAEEVARELGDPDHLARAALGYGEPQVEGGQVDRRLIALLETAIQGLTPEDSPLRARLLARLSLELTFSDEGGGLQESLSLEAIDMARRVGDVVALCNALRARWLARWGPDGLEERTALAAEHMALARDTGDREIELLARARRITCLVESGDGAAAAVDVAAHAALAEELRMPYYAWAAVTMRAGRALLAGSFDRVEPLAEEARDRLRGRPNAGHAHLNQLSMLRWEQGRLGEMRESWQELGERFPQLAFARAWLCLIAAEDGREEAARAGLRELVDSIPVLARNGIWLPAVALASLVAAQLEDRDAAAALYPLLRPYAGRVMVLPMPHPAVCFGSAALYLGMLTTLARDWGAAEQHFEAAVQAHRRLAAKPFLARSYVEHAGMLIQRGQGPDRDRASTLLDRATAIASAVGMKRLDERMAALRPVAATVPATGATASEPVAPTSAASDGPATAAPARHLFRREGQYWTVAHEGSVVRLRDTKGLRCLARLLSSPGRELSAVELEAWDAGLSPADGSGPVSASGSDGADPSSDLGDAGALLDPQAKAEYRERVDELRAELEEAERFNDPGRADRAREELDFLTRELARAVGLGGRDRRAASHAERARLNVTRAIRAAMRTLAGDHPTLANHLSVTVRTGRFCSYTPDPRAPIHWET
jgi:tetratricopeptide (TPR) repeat protein